MSREYLVINCYVSKAKPRHKKKDGSSGTLKCPTVRMFEESHDTYLRNDAKKYLHGKQFETG